MDVQIIGRHLEITSAIRSYVSQKVGKLGKFFDGLSRVKVNLSYVGSAGGIHRTELIFSVVRGKTLIAHAEDADLLASVDSAVGKGERLLTKFKAAWVEPAKCSPWNTGVWSPISLLWQRALLQVCH